MFEVKQSWHELISLDILTTEGRKNLLSAKYIAFRFFILSVLRMTREIQLITVSELIDFVNRIVYCNIDDSSS